MNLQLVYRYVKKWKYVLRKKTKQNKTKQKDQK